MGNYYRYDAHCHIFTLQYAVKEVKSMLHDMIHGTYPWNAPPDKALLTFKGSFSDLKDLLRQLYELIHAAGDTEDENLNFLQNGAGVAFPSDSFRIIPLMMDIFYMLAYPLDKDQDILSMKEMKATPVDEKDFQDSWNEILDDFKDYLQPKKNALKATVKAKDKRVEKALQIIEKERSVKETLKSKSRTLKLTDSLAYYQTDGYCFHMNNLMELVKARNGELYPFIAFDPRRPGMIDALLNGNFFSGDAKFYGVKLYPRMGYHPQSKPMDSVYKFCNDNHLPIIFHCGKSGFPPSDTWKYYDYGNPANFEAVVQKYPDLKIDFAHLGSSDPTYDWSNTIIRLINENENVYSDLSCYTNTDELNPIRKFWDYNSRLRSRLMFGTDFDVMYFTDKVTMQIYYNNFKSIFNLEELKILMHDNPERFMGINSEN